MNKFMKICTSFLILAFSILSNACSDDKNTEIESVQKKPVVTSQKDEFDLSLGGIKIGMTRDELYNIVGKEKSVKNMEGAKYPLLQYDNLAVAVAENDLVVGMISNFNATDVITEKNIHPGSSIEELFELYGRECVFIANGDSYGNDLYEYPFNSKSGQPTALMSFHVKNNIVEYIALSLISNAQYTDLLSKVATVKDVVRTSEFDLSIGGLKLGSTPEEVKKLLGNNYTETLIQGYPQYSYNDLTIVFIDGVAQVIVSNTNNVKTERGISQGSTVEQLFSIYGNYASLTNDNGYENLHYLFDSSQGRSAVFQFMLLNGYIDRISLRVAPNYESLMIKNSATHISLVSPQTQQFNSSVNVPVNNSNTTNLPSIGFTLNQFVENYNSEVIWRTMGAGKITYPNFNDGNSGSEKMFDELVEVSWTRSNNGEELGEIILTLSEIDGKGRSIDKTFTAMMQAAISAVAPNANVNQILSVDGIMNSPNGVTRYADGKAFNFKVDFSEGATSLTITAQ